MHRNQFYTYHTNILLWLVIPHELPMKSPIVSPLTVNHKSRWAPSFPPPAPSWAADVDEAQEPANSHKNHGGSAQMIMGEDLSTQ